MRKTTLLCLLTLFCAGGVSAQNVDIEAFGSLSFGFGNPGARSLGMGGAFIGLADDATAAEANPAGLTTLQSWETSAEISYYESSKPLPVSGNFPNVVYKDFSSSSTDLKFLSLVVPYGENWRFAAVYQKQLNEDFSTNQVEGNIYPCTPNPDLPDDPNCSRLQKSIFDIPMDIDSMGVSAAWKSGAFSVGATAKYQTFEESAVRSGVNSAGIEQTRKEQYSDDSDVTFIVGGRWTPTSRFGLGLVYKEGAEFDTDVRFRSSFRNDDFKTGFHLPDAYGGGVFFRPMDQWVVTVDIVRLDYSNLTDNFISLTEQVVNSNDYEIDDGNELHLGTEYAIPSKNLAIRAGWWLEPEHAIKYTGRTDIAGVSGNQGRRQSIYFPGGDEQDHFTFGVGYITPTYSIDLGIDEADLNTRISASFVWRFR